MKLDWLHEKKNKTASSGILLYVVSVIFICYQSFRLKGASLPPFLWSALFWVVVLFSVTNASVRTFDFFKDGRFLYYYQLSKAQYVILAKFFYNSLFLTFVNLVAFVIYALVMNLEQINFEIFLPTLVLGSTGLGFTLTSVSGIAAKAGNAMALIAILAFPLLLPQLLLLVKLTKSALDMMPLTSSSDELLSLLGINLISLALGYLLFPYLWRA
ncbi:MAG: heme exporter protein CcmB [Cytophagales bacterium]